MRELCYVCLVCLTLTTPGWAGDIPFSGGGGTPEPGKQGFGGAGGSPPDTPPSATDRWLDLQEVCKVDYPPHAAGEVPYGKWRTYEVYQLALFQEMCLSWYAMQQPKYHGILLSRGAPNF